jgi:hypothetical protein
MAGSIFNFQSSIFGLQSAILDFQSPLRPARFDRSASAVIMPSLDTQSVDRDEYAARRRQREQARIHP